MSSAFFCSGSGKSPDPSPDNLTLASTCLPLSSLVQIHIKSTIVAGFGNIFKNDFGNAPGLLPRKRPLLEINLNLSTSGSGLLALPCTKRGSISRGGERWDSPARQAVPQRWAPALSLAQPPRWFRCERRFCVRVGCGVLVG